MRRFAICALVALTFLSTSVLADGTRHVIDPATLAAAVDRHAASEDDSRAEIRTALARPEVRTVAQSLGLDLDRANALVDTLNGDRLDQAAAAAREVNESLAGGSSTVTFSATTIIIALLVIILIIVAVH